MTDRLGDDAWERLSRWLEPELPEQNPAYALRALGDVTMLRHLIDQAELRAVRVARTGAASWTEIATQLGISRQAAWEKWRDLEGDESHESHAHESGTDGMRELQEAARQRMTRMREQRRGKVPVPDVVGLGLRAASAVLSELGLEAVQAGPAATSVDATVVRQYPEPEVRIPRGSQVRLWTEGGGEAGVRQPRRPRPVLRADAADLEVDLEPSDRD